MGVVNVADGGDADVGDFGERLHQRPATAAGADAADVERLVGGFGSRGRSADGGGRGGGSHQEGAARNVIGERH